MAFHAYKVMMIIASILGLAVMWVDGNWDYVLFPIALLVGCYFSLFTEKDLEQKRRRNISTSTWDYFFNSTEEGYSSYQSHSHSKPNEIRYKPKDWKAEHNYALKDAVLRCKKSKVKVTVNK